MKRWANLPKVKKKRKRKKKEKKEKEKEKKRNGRMGECESGGVAQVRKQYC
jgi:hypothetical protein